MHLGKDRLGDVVVAAPVGGSFGIGELVQIVATGLVGEPLRLGVHLLRFIDEMTTATL
ncbi:Uncharacterised protein [Mycobacteroides abscessus subsp. abscessus]|nr:Uncharacterised protein [Mycobacteroides abscessus subsp. abscessus]